MRGLARAERGVAAVELAFVLPLFLVLVLGGAEVGHLLYVRNVLDGEIELAARASSLETAAAAMAAIDQRVRDTVQRVAPGSTVAIERRAYASYQAARSRAEPYIDANTNHACDNGEAFTDLNGNGVWDADSGTDGIGAARAVSLYDVTVSIRPFFPFAARLLGPGPFTVKASTRLRNQPYQAGLMPQTETCP